MTRFLAGPSCSFPLCQVPLSIGSDTAGSFLIENVTINWTDFNPIPLDHSGAITSALKKSNLSIFINVTQGQLELNVTGTFLGSHNITLLAHSFDYFLNTSAQLFAHSSNFNFTAPGEWIVTGASSLTDKNLTGFFGNPAFNFIAGYKGHNADFYVKLNESIDSCVDIFFDNDTDASGAKLMNISAWTTICQNVTPTGVCNLSLFVNLDCVGTSEIAFNPEFCFIPLCDGCVKTFDWEVCHP